MNRFDKNFNDTDPISGRPFSRGYPDGVWVMGIIIGLFLTGTILGTLVASIGTLKETKELATIGGTIIIGLIATLTWASFIFLLIKRSAGVILFSAVIGILILIGGLFSSMNNGGGLTAPIIGFILFLSFAFYGEGLRKDELIGKRHKLNQSVDTTPVSAPR